jgi:hypothetical protein
MVHHDPQIPNDLDDLVVGSMPPIEEPPKPQEKVTIPYHSTEAK